MLAAGVAQGQSPLSSEEGQGKTIEETEASKRSGRKSRKALVVAVDAMDPKLTGRYLDQMPTLRRMKEEGYYGSVLPYATTWGNMNFIAGLSGTRPGTNNREFFPDGSEPSPRDCTAEIIWHTLDKVGRRSMLVSFSQGAPSGAKLAATVSCGKRVHPFLYPGYTLLFGGAVHQTGDETDGVVDPSKIEIAGWPPGGGPRVGRLSRQVADPRPARSGLQGISSKRPPLEVELSLSNDSLNEWLAVITAPDSDEYSSIVLFSDPAKPAVAELKVGEWSAWITETFKLPDREALGHIRFKLLKLDGKGRGLQLLQSGVCPNDRFSEPEELGPKLMEKLGPYSATSAIGMYPLDPYWREGLEECLHREMWVANSAEVGLEAWGWDLFVTKYALIDNAKHQCAMPADPDYNRYDPVEGAKYDEVLREAHKTGDEVFARYLEICEQNNINLIIMGDHGMGLNNVICDLDLRLQNTGLQKRFEDGSIDWTNTVAYAKTRRQGSEVCVNLNGREEHGVVPESEYEDIQDKIIDALIDWRDPESNKRAVAYALKKRDISVLGYYGSVVSDIMFAYNPGFSWGVLPNGKDIHPSFGTATNHGAQIPTGETAYNSNLGVLFAWGPDIKPGHRDEEMKGPILMDQLAPTLSELLDCPLPKDCTAAPIREMIG